VSDIRSGHRVGTREEWLAARLALLEAEKELTRRSDELARERMALPWVPIDKDYRFATEEGEATLADLFRGRSQLLVYHFMFDPDWDEGCPSCSGVADGFAGSIPHFEHHDVAFVVVSRAPREKLLAYKRRMGWDFRWFSSFGSSFNYDFHATIDPAVAPVEYNYRDQSQLEAQDVAWRDWSGEQPGMSAFARDGDDVFHTYSAYARGFDGLWPCGNGSTVRHSAATKATSPGSIGTTSTANDELSPRGHGPVRRRARRRFAVLGPVVGMNRECRWGWSPE
jgi:predicted dithiol-disulfide oxidoreductase (DUF899 family)